MQIQHRKELQQKVKEEVKERQAERKAKLEELKKQKVVTKEHTTKTEVLEYTLIALLLFSSLI